MFLNPLNWGKKKDGDKNSESPEEKAAKDAELAERAAAAARQASADKATIELEKQLRNLNERIEETLLKLDNLEIRKVEEMKLVAAADAEKQETRKKMHWRNKKRVEDEIKATTSHMAQLEDMRSTCEKRISQLHRQQDLQLATEALQKAKVDVEEVENVLEDAREGVENVSEVDQMMNSFQLTDEVYDDDEMAAELASFREKEDEEQQIQEEISKMKKSATKQGISESELSEMMKPEVPTAAPAEDAKKARAGTAREEDELKRLEKELAM